LLTLRRLSKSYVPGKPVLVEIDLEIASRGITAISRSPNNVDREGMSPDSIPH